MESPSRKCTVTCTEIVWSLQFFIIRTVLCSVGFFYPAPPFLACDGACARKPTERHGNIFMAFIFCSCVVQSPDICKSRAILSLVFLVFPRVAS